MSIWCDPRMKIIIAVSTFVVFLFGALWLLGFKFDRTKPQTADRVIADKKNSPSPEPASFMGWRFGEDIRQQVPECPSNWWEWKSPCRRPLTDNMFDIHNVLVGERSLGHVVAMQLNGRFESVHVTFASDRFIELLEIFRARYGEPSSKSDEVWRSKAGATFSNNIASWSWPNINILLEERGAKVDEGIAIYTTQAWRSAQENERSKAVRDAVGKL